MKAKYYLPVLAVILCIMSVWWKDALMDMLQHHRIADIFLFFILGISSSLSGYLILIFILILFSIDGLKCWMIITISSFISLCILWVISLKLIEIMTII